jgi:hypothetical protein
MTFLDLIPLPAFDGLPLAATGTRALERFSDLVDGAQKPVDLATKDRFDIIDDCLDLVILRNDLPSGFEFTGMSLTDFWRALLAAHGGESCIDLWRSCLNSEQIAELREAARKRIGVRASGNHLHSRRLWLPDVYSNVPMIEMPEPLVKLLKAAAPNWINKNRNRFCIESLKEVGIPGRKLPTRGLRYPKPQNDGLRDWLRAEPLRLQNQFFDLGYEYSELQLCLPSLEESYFNTRSLARNVFAHIRTTRFRNSSGQFVMVLDEIVSDWVAEYKRQSIGESLPAREVLKGKSTPASDLPPIPECSVAEDWLELALSEFLDFAKKCSCSVIAWVPGIIQHELDPNLPLIDLQKLYDQDVPQTLTRLSGTDATSCTINYATYRRNLLMRHKEPQGWYLVESDGITPLSDPVKERDSLHELFRSQAEPVIETLPGILLHKSFSAEVVEATEEFNPGHGAHWGALYDLDTYSSELIIRDLEESKLIDQFPAWTWPMAATALKRYSACAGEMKIWRMKCW